MLERIQVVAIYKQVLGRTPSEPEIEEQLAANPDLDALLRLALDSEEYAARLREVDMETARDPTLVNVFHPDLAAWAHPPGTKSGDGSAIVGHQGCLFLYGGANANLEQFLGTTRRGLGWLEAWRALVGRRAEEMRELGVASALLVVPDKLAVHEDLYPEALERIGPRPVEVLLDGGVPLAYPLAELRAAREAGDEVFPRTDTHLTFRANELLFAAIAEALAAKAPDHSALPLEAYAMAGDLGIKFDPAIVSVVREPGTLGAAAIAEDNRERIAAVDGHIGTRRVFVNESAPDRRVAVVFGDSFGFAGPRYQGISWFLAQVFRETHFVWIPFGWDAEYVRRAGAEAVLVQGAERFLGRIPHADVDVSRLAEETLARKRPASIEHVSS
jgi:hypothetical protein